MEPNATTNEYLHTIPFTAALWGKDDDDRLLLSSEFSALSDVSRELLTSTNTADRIASWQQQGLFPPTHTLAVAKIVGLIALGEIPSHATKDLLLKVGLDEPHANQVAQQIQQLLAPVLTERATWEVPEKIEELPPLTTKIPAAIRPSEPGRNIMDLRKKP